MKWQEVCEHPSLKDLPFKIELNEDGKILMTPVKVSHSLYQGEIEFLLRSQLKEGKALPECAIKTAKGTKVADVAWVSPERLNRVKNAIECPIAPEICIEILSSSNEEIIEKRRLYFDAGAFEVWICDADGHMRFYDAKSQLAQSKLVPRFPKKIEI